MKERLVVVLVVVLVVAVLVASYFIMRGVVTGDAITGDASSDLPFFNSSTCKDSDSGVFSDIGGYVTTYDSKGKATGTMNDVCRVQSKVVSYGRSRYTVRMAYVTEYYCDWKGRAVSANIACASNNCKDVTACLPYQHCGNGVLEGTEQCDLGYSGNGACPKGCSYGCTKNTCATANPAPTPSPTPTPAPTSPLLYMTPTPANSTVLTVKNFTVKVYEPSLKNVTFNLYNFATNALVYSTTDVTPPFEQNFTGFPKGHYLFSASGRNPSNLIYEAQMRSVHYP